MAPNIETLLAEYQSLPLTQIIDYERFNNYAIVHHSTVIEGSTLTEIETRRLLESNLTPNAKPLTHSLMVADHYGALQFIKKRAAQKQLVTPQFVQQINAQVLKKTGAIYRTVFGDIDSSLGEYRKSNVSAGVRYFPNYAKVENLLQKLCVTLQKQMNIGSKDVVSKLYIAFDAHFELVSIHPFYDGNGRTSRLLMNYIQLYFDLPMAIVFQEDKTNYYQALEETRKQEDINVFRAFMVSQYAKYLKQEIDKFNALNA
jgi:Fic family protein